MKKFIVIAIAFSCLNIEAYAQSGWFTQSSGIGNRLYSVHFADKSTGWAVGEEGIILKTTNGGINWTTRASGTYNLLYSVNFADNRTGWAVGSEGTIIKTTNGGTNWMLQSSGTSHLLCSVNFADNNTSWAVGNAGTIVKTTNGGTNWTMQTSGTSNGLRSVHFEDSNTGWAVGDEGIILKTTNGGSNWTRQTGTGFWLRSVHFIDNNIGWTVGEWSNILKTTNGGTNWITQLSGTGDWLRSVYFIDISTGWAVGEHSIILSTSNGGTNWMSQTSGTIQWLWSVHFASNSTGWAVGDFGTILKTTTGGIWYPQTCMITGPDTVYPGPDVLFISDRTPGTWSLNNESGTNALIVSDPDNDSVYVNPGSENGQFSLAYSSSDSDYCSMAVRVIAPVNLNYSCMFQSGHLFADTRFGYSVNSAGDFNGDGIDDLVMGTPWTGGPVCWAGIYYGPPNCSANMDILIYGEIPNFGSSVSPAGDVNRDGYDDVVIGSYGNENMKGRAYVFLGNPSGSQIRIVLEGEYNGDAFGYSVCKAGDVNLDGFDDVIIGSGSEKAFIYFGGQQMDNVPDVILERESPNSAFGRSVSYAGDVNGDGFSDVVVGAYLYLNNTGRAYVYFGGRQMDNLPDVVMSGEAVGFDIMLGSYVGSAGDIDNDGFKDIVIGQGDEGHCINRVEIFKGGQTMDNVPDLKIFAQTDCESFHSVFLNDDFNGDSYSDVLVGAPRYNIDDGRAYMFLGSSNMDNMPDYIMNTVGDSGRFGFSASIAGDVNADGYLDAVIGAPSWGPEEEWGVACVYYGFGDPHKTLSNLSLSPQVFVTDVGSTSNEIAVVKNRYNEPMPDVRINFFRRGIQRSYFSDLSANDGNVMYQLNSNSPGVDTVISVSGRFTDTSYIVWRSADDCIWGPQNVGINSTNLYVYSGQSDVRFELMNIESADARIVSVNSNDSVYVESGALNGRFALSVHNGDSILCMEVMNVNSANPVQLTSFTSKVEGKTVLLVWSTATEENNSGFEVQRSGSDNEFKNLSFIKGRLTSSEKTEYSFTDKNLATGSYNYRLKQIDFNGNFEYFELPEAVMIGIPDKFFLEQNYPNPFNPVTTITFGIPEAGNVKLKIFDMSGREVKTLISEFKEAGYYTVKFDASGIASGAYFYRIETGEVVSVKKMVFLK